jgi:uncharacterized membrane protein
LPLHWALGIASYGLFAAAVVHAWLMMRAERQIRQAAEPQAGLPLLTLERLTFRFATGGFVLLSATLLAGVVFGEAAGGPGWRWDHKTSFSVLAWLAFATLLTGRARFGWRGRRAVRMLYVGSLLLLLSLASGEWTQPLHISARSAASLLYLIVFGSLIGFSTYMWLLKVASPTAVGTYAYVNPAVAVLLGVLFAGERLPAQAVAAMTVILGGVAMVSIAGGGAKRMVKAVWRVR